MDGPTVVTVMMWIWLLAAAGQLVLMAYLTITEGIGDWTADLGVSVAVIAGFGSLVLSLRGLGFLETALWTWRIAAIGYLVVALVGVKEFRSPPAPWSTPPPPPGLPQPTPKRKWLVAPANVIACLLLILAAFLTQNMAPGKTTSTASVSPLKTILPPLQTVTFTIDGVRLWHGVALLILAVGTLVFLTLFVRMLERGVAPQLESYWGGIGGGMGGWRLSESLTYLAAAVVFGVLFAIFVFQLEGSAKPPAGGTAPQGKNTLAKTP